MFVFLCSYLLTGIASDFHVPTSHPSLTAGGISLSVDFCKYEWRVYSSIVQVLLNHFIIGFRQGRRWKVKYAKGGRAGTTCDAVYYRSDSSPTYLISLFMIKNYSRADIINLPTQPYTLNGAL